MFFASLCKKVWVTVVVTASYKHLNIDYSHSISSKGYISYFWLLNINTKVKNDLLVSGWTLVESLCSRNIKGPVCDISSQSNGLKRSRKYFFMFQDV